MRGVGVRLPPSALIMRYFAIAWVIIWVAGIVGVLLSNQGDSVSWFFLHRTGKIGLIPLILIAFGVGVAIAILLSVGPLTKLHNVYRNKRKEHEDLTREAKSLRDEIEKTTEG